MVSDYVREMRIRHWYKALIVFSGPLFSGAMDSVPLAKVVLAFFAFGFAASSVYVINDLNDVEDDRKHPRKRHRPIASGRIPEGRAWAFSGLLLAVSLSLAWLAGSLVLHLVLSYLGLMLVYTYWLKEVAVVDAFVIAAGFVLRALAGCFAAGIRITDWFYLVIFSFAVYLAFCKRIAEIEVAGRGHKKTLGAYEKLAEVGTAISGAATLSLYAIYTTERNGLLLWSVPLAFLAMLLHLRETYQGREVHEALRKPEMLVTGAAFVVLVFLSMY